MTIFTSVQSVLKRFSQLSVNNTIVLKRIYVCRSLYRAKFLDKFIFSSYRPTEIFIFLTLISGICTKRTGIVLDWYATRNSFSSRQKKNQFHPVVVVDNHGGYHCHQLLIIQTFFWFIIVYYLVILFIKKCLMN